MSLVVGASIAAFAAVASAQLASDMELEHMQLLNELRAEGFTCPNGKVFEPNSEALIFDCRLWRAAWLHSHDMAENRYFSHYSQNGDSPWDRSAAQGIAASGENIQGGVLKTTAAKALSTWKNSNGHCVNMMNPDKKLFAVAHAHVDGSPYTHYWTQMFAGSNWVDSLDTSCIPEVGETPSPTPQPTPAPVVPTPKPTYDPNGPTPTATPTPAPTFSQTVVCRPLTDCIADDACYEKYLPICSQYGTHNCGMPAEYSNDPNTELCAFEVVSTGDLTQLCLADPDDSAATYDDCYRTTYMNEAQCLEGGASRGVTCVWITTVPRY